jgi:hypothetical protein
MSRELDKERNTEAKKHQKLHLSRLQIRIMQKVD